MIAAAACYLAGAWRVRRRHPRRPWPAGRTLAFCAALGVIVVATQSGVAVYDDTVFSAHMVQHVLLIMVAPPLLVFGRPLTLLLHAAGNPVHTWVKRLLRTPAVRALTWPAGVTAGYVIVVAGTHTPLVMDLVLRNDLAHDAEHALYLAVGYLYFLPIVGAEPIGWRISMPARYLMLLIGMQADTLVGVALLIQGHEVFAGYARGGGPAAAAERLADLHRGGAIMFIGSDVVMAVLALAVCVAMVRDPRWAGRLGGWMEGLRRAALLRQVGSAGLSVATSAGRAATIDDEAHLAAYNAYLASLGDGGRQDEGARPAN